MITLLGGSRGHHNGGEEEQIRGGRGKTFFHCLAIALHNQGSAFILANHNVIYVILKGFVIAIPRIFYNSPVDEGNLIMTDQADPQSKHSALPVVYYS